MYLYTANEDLNSLVFRINKQMKTKILFNTIFKYTKTFAAKADV